MTGRMERVLHSNVVSFCRRHRSAVYLLTIAAVIAGAASLYQLPSNIYPEMTFPRIVILAKSGDLAPDTMMLTVTRPIEEEVSTVLGVRRVRSRTIRGSAEVSVLFSDNVNMDNALQMVQSRVGQVQSEMPAGTTVDVERLSPTVWPILSMMLTGNAPSADLNDFAVYNLRPVFSRVPGVARIEVNASDTREVSVIIDPQKALAHRISMADISERLRATNTVTSVGKIDSRYQQFLILANSQFLTLDQIGNSVVGSDPTGPVRLRDIAEVREGTADRQMIVTGDGKPAAVINVTRQIGGDILDVSKQVKDAAFHTENVIPQTLHLSIVYDLAEFVQESMSSVRDAILIGSVLAVLILFIFLRNFRITIAASVSLPLTVIATFFFIKIFGGTLNLMSLGGLAIAIGLVIDDAVVIVENIYRHLGAGEVISDATEKGVSELMGPVIFSTLTTVVVFLPLGLLSGAVGDFFSALSLTLTVSVLLSLIFALTLVPLLSETLLKNSKFRESSARFIEPVQGIYEIMLRAALDHKWVVGVIVVLLIVGTVFAGNSIGTGFLPEMDEGGYVLDYLTPPGTSLAQTDAIVKKLEAMVKETPETQAFSRRTGAELGLYATDQNKGDILVKLKPRSQRKRDIYAVIHDLREKVATDIVGADIEFTQILQDMLNDLEGVREPIEVKIFGSNSDDLNQIASSFGEKMQKVKGVVDFKGAQRGNPEMFVRIDPTAAAHIGMTVEQVSQQLHAGLFGDSTTNMRLSDRLVPIRIRYPDEYRYREQNLAQFQIISPTKQVAPLSSLATITEERGPNQLLRENQRLMVVLTANIEGRDLGSTVADIQKLLKATKLPVGYTYEIGGQYETQQDSFQSLLYVLGLALASVFTLLVFQFRSFLPALIILSAAPLSVAGVFALLLLTGTPLNVSSYMGVILMVGLVVKNGIILFEYFEHRQGELSLYDAMVEAGRIRLRPILMTTLCTLFGLLPLALGIGSGAELQKPLAIAVIGGLSISTFITLIVMPVVYATFRKNKPAQQR